MYLKPKSLPKRCNFTSPNKEQCRHEALLHTVFPTMSDCESWEHTASSNSMRQLLSRCRRRVWEQWSVEQSCIVWIRLSLHNISIGSAVSKNYLPHLYAVIYSKNKIIWQHNCFYLNSENIFQIFNWSECQDIRIGIETS